MSTVFTGSATALVTPFDENGKVNYEKLKELIEFQIKNKTERKVISQEMKKAEKQRQFKLKQQKRKEKHRGR